MPRKKNIPQKITPKYIQIAEKDYVFACEILTRLNVEYMDIPGFEDDIDFIQLTKEMPERNYGLS